MDIIPRWQPYKRRFNVQFKRCTIKQFISSKRNNIYNISKARYLNPSYREFRLHIEEDIRWVWAINRLKFYPTKSNRDINVICKARGVIPMSFESMRSRKIVIYIEDLQ